MSETNGSSKPSGVGKKRRFDRNKQFESGGHPRRNGFEERDSRDNGEEPREPHGDREKHSDLITGRNAVTEALKSGRPIECVMTARSSDNGGRSFGQIIAMAKERGITVKEVSPAKLDAARSSVRRRRRARTV